MSQHARVYINSAHMACKPNAVLTCSIARYIKGNNHQIVTDIAGADYVIYSTCGFTSSEEERCVGFLREASTKVKPGAKLLAVGCLCRITPDLFQKNGLPEVEVLADERDLDRYFAVTSTYNDIRARYVDDTILDQTGLIIPSDISARHLRKWVSGVEHLANKSTCIGRLLAQNDNTNSVFVEIGTGCTGRCSFCIIKRAKGNPRSRSPAEILDDIRSIDFGGRTLRLVGDDCASYGADIGANLCGLVSAIRESFPALPIAIGYVNPFWLLKHKEQYIEMLEKTNIVLITITAQSGSNRVIKKMNRRYDPRELAIAVKRLRTISPRTVFTAHILVGFPGETLTDFVASLRLMFAFDASSVFNYSDRDGTPSAVMPDKVSPGAIRFRGRVATLHSRAITLLRTLKDLL